MVGQTLSTYLDVRSKNPVPLDETVESLCWDEICVCAERGCKVRCSYCRTVTASSLKAEICAPYAFGSSFFSCFCKKCFRNQFLVSFCQLSKNFMLFIPEESCPIDT